MFFDDPEPLRLTGEWAEAPRGYRYKFGRKGVDVQVHPDPRVQAIVEQIRENESLQAVDRLRLIHNIEQKTVYLLSNLPLDIDVDELRPWDEIINGGNRLEQAWDRQKEGVLSLNPAWLAANFPDLWVTKAAAKKDVSRSHKEGQSSNRISIRRLSLFEFEYKSARERVWHRAVSRFSSESSVAEALQKALGEVVSVRLVDTLARRT